MAILMGKFKNKDWQEIDHANNNDNETKDFLIQEYKNELGQGWMFEWRDENKIQE